MITYRKKSLKVETIHASTGGYLRSTEKYTRRVSQGVKDFIEKGEYSRIAEMIFFGEDESLTCLIIYEEKKGN